MSRSKFPLKLPKSIKDAGAEIANQFRWEMHNGCSNKCTSRLSYCMQPTAPGLSRDQAGSVERGCAMPYQNFSLKLLA